MYREIVDWSTSKISAQISSVMLLRAYPQATISASRKVSARGRPVSLVPWFFEQFVDAFLQLVKLLSIQS